ncbi:hypothetical protein CRE_30169 [Caenorhabditis remanei]|uniref:Uncharacterized protein n=1 Tax=Caenorhabditis remanei TaxID=31234 RepID=E3NE22_CAERE|nr:hypothetical protein CRE_30169 [Caenorhabditis remanei]
MLMRYYSMFG